MCSYDKLLSLSKGQSCHGTDLSALVWQVVEMTEACQAFFKQKFAEFDKNNDALLSLQEQAEMFSTAPSGYGYQIGLICNCPLACCSWNHPTGNTMPVLVTRPALWPIEQAQWQ